MRITTEIEHFISDLIVLGRAKGSVRSWNCCHGSDVLLEARSARMSRRPASRSPGAMEKRSLISAALGLAGFVGPASQPGAAVVIVASSFSQARICFSHMVGFLKSSDLYKADPKRFGVSENSRVCEIIDRYSRSTCRAGGSDPRRLHGTAPVICIIDEPASHTHGNRDAIFAACITSLGKVPNSKLIAVGTKSSDPGHWFNVGLGGAGGFDFAQCHDASGYRRHFQRSRDAGRKPELVQNAQPATRNQVSGQIRRGGRGYERLISRIEVEFGRGR